MRVFIIDHLLYLLIGVGLSIAAPILFPKPILIIILELLIVISWGILCKSILLLPLDLIFGKRVTTCYFGTPLSTYNYEFFRKKCYWNWRFYVKGSNKRLDLYNPVSCRHEGLASIELPPKDFMIEVTYYPLSKMLIGWKIHTAE